MDEVEKECGGERERGEEKGGSRGEKGFSEVRVKRGSSNQGLAGKERFSKRERASWKRERALLFKGRSNPCLVVDSDWLKELAAAAGAPV
jgi:hypothetical protein